MWSFSLPGPPRVLFMLHGHVHRKSPANVVQSFISFLKSPNWNWWLQNWGDRRNDRTHHSQWYPGGLRASHPRNAQSCNCKSWSSRLIHFCRGHSKGFIQLQAINTASTRALCTPCAQGPVGKEELPSWQAKLIGQQEETGQWKNTCDNCSHWLHASSKFPPRNNGPRDCTSQWGSGISKGPV